MAKDYILYYEWQFTRGNHAGMSYLAKELEAGVADVQLLKHVNQEFRGGKVVAYLHALVLSIYLLIKLKKGDRVLFMEYLTGNFAYQHIIGKLIHLFHLRVKRLGLVHLDGPSLQHLLGSNEEILRRLSHVDEVLVFGSSLKTFLQGIGCQTPITVTYHYVDTHYYQPKKENKATGLEVIFIGNLKRDFNQLIEIIQTSSGDILFHICLGKQRPYAALRDLPNVKQYGYMEEDALLALTQQADASLSVLQDTIGSNAITASLATGLVQVVSDVGSIRDYCNEANAFFCRTTADFVQALQRLHEDPVLLRQMKKMARSRAEELSLDNFKRDFKHLLSHG